MTELAIRDERTDLATPGPAPVEAHASALVLWAYEAQQAARIAASLAKTSFVPASLRGRPEDITAAILAGQELGLRPMASLRSMDIIQGTPALRAHAMRGLVQSHGHAVQLVESTETHCLMRGRRAGEQEWQEVAWTIQRADRLGLTGKNEWKRQPQTMLVARATGEICRLIAADVLHAMPYAAEEIDNIEAAPPAPARVTAAEVIGRAAEPQESAPDGSTWPNHAENRFYREAEPVTEQPAAPSTVDSAPAPEPPSRDEAIASIGQGRPLTDRQRNTINAIAPKIGLKDRDLLHHYLSDATGRLINSVNDLTNREASTCIDLMQDLEKRDGGGQP